MRPLQRNKRAETTVTVDATGAATAVIDVVPGPSWEVKQVSLSCTGSAIPQAATYVGRNSAGVFISSTYLGNSDTDSLPNVTLRSGESICAIWSNGTSGSRAKLTVVYDEVGY